MSANLPLNALTWFEIPAVDYNKTKQFYESLLDVELTNEPMGPPEQQMFYAKFPTQDGDPVTGAVCQGPHLKPGDSGTVIYLACQDLDASLGRLEALGGAIIAPKMALPDDLGDIAVIRDCDGNTVGLHGR